MAETLASPRFLDVRPGERAPAGLAFATLFGLVAAHTSLETARDALFLTELPPERLPAVYVMVAVAGLFVGRASSWLGRRFGRQNALLLTLILAAIGTTLLYFRAVTAPLAFGLYVWTALVGSLAVIQFWLVTSERFTSSQSKRLFGAIGAGGVMGAVFSSGVSVGLLQFLPVQSLLLFGSFGFLATAVLITLNPIHEGDLPSVRRRKGGIPLITKQPYLLRLAALVVFSTLCLLTLDYLFKSAAARAMPKSELGPFFARYYGALNTAGLVVQLFVASRVMRRFGVVAALAILPLCLLSGSIAFVALGASFVPLLATKGADGAFRYSIHRVASELLYVPLDPALRDRVKPVLDSSLGKLCQAIGAGSLLGLAMIGIDDVRLLAFLVAGLAFAWLVIASTLRRPYLDLFRNSLGRPTFEPGFDLDRLDLGAAEVVIESLSSPDPARAIAAMNLLAEAKRSRLVPALILFHESEDVLLRALDVVPDAQRQDWVPLAERLLSHDSGRVQLAAARALSRHGRLSPRAPETPAVRAYLAVDEVKKSGARPEEHPAIQLILAADDDNAHITRIALLDAIHDDAGPAWTPLLVSMDGTEAVDVSERLVRAMSAVKDPRFLPLLIRRLRGRLPRSIVRDALVEFGDAGLEALASAVADIDLSPKVRVHLPRAIAEFGTQEATDVLVERLANEPSGVVRFRVLRALGHLVVTHRVRIKRPVVLQVLRRNLIEHLRLSALYVPFDTEPPVAPSGRLLAGLVRDKMRQALERAFRLLALLYPKEDLRSVYFAMQSREKTDRANALEFLDTLVLREEAEIRELLHLVADDLQLAERAERAASVVSLRPRTVRGAIAALIGDPDDELAQLSAYHARAAGISELQPEAERILEQSTLFGPLGAEPSALASDPRAAAKFRASLQPKAPT
jgi:AAA family ATP:ADP antiporter